MKKKCLEEPKTQINEEEHLLVKKILALPQDILLSSKDLIELGVCRSVSRLGVLRHNGIGPKWLLIPLRTYRYSPRDVVDWLRSCQNMVATPAVNKNHLQGAV